MVQTVQTLFVLMCGPLLGFLLRANVEKNNIFLMEGKPVIVVANHPSRLDPFLLSLLPFAMTRKLIPVYFLTTRKYYDTWWLKVFIKCLGGYPTKEEPWHIDGSYEDTLKKLRRKQNVMIFPEGKIVKTAHDTQAKAGIVYLGIDSGAQILPIHIKGIEGMSLSDILFRKRSLVVSLGTPFTLEKKNIASGKTSYASVAESIMRLIYSL